MNKKTPKVRTFGVFCYDSFFIILVLFGATVRTKRCKAISDQISVLRLAAEVDCNCDGHEYCLNNNENSEELEGKLPVFLKRNSGESCNYCCESGRPDDVL